jgi:hypothetical protein
MGLLVLRGCGAPAMGACSSCGRPLCVMHQVMGGAGISCPECAAIHGDPSQNEQAQEAADRNSYYNSYGGGEFGDDQYFSDEDQEAVRSGFAATGAEHAEYDPFDT